MSESWQDRYQSKLTDAASAVKLLKPGDRVFLGSACGEPQSLVRAMVEGSSELADTEIMHVLTLGLAPYAEPKYRAHFRANAFFIGQSLRDAVNEARADYTPVFLSQLPELFRSRRTPIDVALITVSPPDEHGFCSLGASVDITRAAVDSARTVIAQVNRRMPRTLGESFVHIDKFTRLIEQDEPLLEWRGASDHAEEAERIAEHIASLVPDGATLQLGIGRVPNAVLHHLDDKNDLGIHTEMMSDGVMTLSQKGVINGSKKTLHRGKIVASFAAGSQELFDFIDNNPTIEMRPSDYTNDPFIIRQNDNMVSINSALQVDLTGQVCADSMGERLYSGLGGHADFTRGAAMAKHGRPIIAMPATAVDKDGKKVSRIVADLAQGAGVVTTRGDIHYVLTEYGVAFLHGRTLRERAMSLIHIAAPEFRAELLHAAKRRRLVYADQILPPPTRTYPKHWESNLDLPSGQRVRIRPIRPDDESRMKEMFYSFSEQTVHFRFHHRIKSLPHNKLQVFCNIDYDTEVTLIAVTGQPGHEDVIAVGSYVTDPSKRVAELAFVVSDDWQRNGIGSFLLKKLTEVGQENGVQRFEADVLAENVGMLKIFHRSGLAIETTTEGGVVHVTMQVPAVASL